MPRTISRKSKSNPHEILGCIAGVQARFLSSEAHLSKIDPKTGIPKIEPTKLNGLLSARAREGEPLMTEYKNSVKSSPNLFKKKCFCCCCCCCRSDEPSGSGSLWINDLNYDTFVVFSEQGITAHNHLAPDKKANGGAGSGDKKFEEVLSRISFGFRTQFDLPFDSNAIRVRSGVHVNFDQIEVQSFGWATSQVLVKHYVLVSTGAFHTDKTSTLFSMIAYPFVSGQGGWFLGDEDSEIEVEFERTGQGSTIVVDEATIVEAWESGNLSDACAHGHISASYELLHVVIRDLS